MVKLSTSVSEVIVMLTAASLIAYARRSMGWCWNEAEKVYSLGK